MVIIMNELTNDFRTIMGNTLPIIILVSVIGIIFRIYMLKINNKKIRLSREVPNLFFLIYILCLFQIVTSQDISSTHGINITFFKELTRYELGTRLFYRNIIGNIMLFVPFSFFIAHIFKIKNRWLVYLFTFLVSITIETTQLYIGRAFDVDDVLLNFIGGIIGYFIYNLVNNVILKNVNKENKDIIIAVLLVIVVSGIFMVIV